MTADARGVLAAAATAFCWALTAFYFSRAARRIGHLHVNQIRLLIACGLLLVGCAAFGAFGPASWPQLGLLGLSGLIGLTLGDTALFWALRIIGPRRGSLLMALAPGFAAVLMVPLLSESLSIAGVAGMGLTLGGVAWVIRERAQPGEVQGNASLGVVLGVLAAIGQAAGLVLAKAGLGAAPSGSWLAESVGDSELMHPLYGTLVRMVVAAAVLSTYGVLSGSIRDTVRALRDRDGMRWTIRGAIFGPVLGVSLSLAAVSWTNTAVAATIMATSPVVVIPVIWLADRQRASARAIAGSLVAIAGVAVLTWRDRIAALF